MNNTDNHEVLAILRHQWVRLSTLPGVAIPLAGFGASDCKCESHLCFFQSHPVEVID